MVSTRPLRALRTTWLARSTTRPFQQRTARGGRAGMAPPRLRTRARRAGQHWVVGCARLDLDPPATPPSRRPGPAAAPTVTGPLAQRRQRRRRITPNTNTTTTTTISTHNHVDMAASLVDAGAVQADATAAHPSKQLGHGQATSRAQIDARAARGLAGTPAPRDLPADLGWPGGRQTGRRPRPGPVGLSPSGPRPASPAQPPQPAPHELRTRAGGNRPDATTATPTGGYGEAEQSLQLLFAVGDRARAPCPGGSRT
jgi:hypothetical protein